MAGTPAWMEALPLTVLRAELTPMAPWRHDEPALALRGALGSAMLHLLCVRDEPECAPCPRKESCLVPGWFDPARAGLSRARPFWLRVESQEGLIAPDRPLVLIWTFLGALPRPSLALEALQRVALVGLGEERVPHEVRLCWRGPEGWTAQGNPEPVPLSALVGAVPELDQPLSVRTLSRLRLRRDGQPLRRPLLSDLLKALLLRVRDLERQLGVESAHTWPMPTPGHPASRCDWETGSRFSARQQRPVDLSGVRATWALAPGDAPEHRDLLAAAQWLQVGAATTAGLGVLAVTEEVPARVS